MTNPYNQPPPYGQPLQYHHPPPQGPGPKTANNLGIVAVVVGAVGLAAAMVPCCGMIVAIPLGLIGGILGLVGFIAASADQRTSRTLPVIGMAVSVLALAITFAWPLILSAIAPPPRPITAPTTLPGGFQTAPSTAPADGDGDGAEE